jgi:hypothetical protein
MANTVFIVPELDKNGCWYDYRVHYTGGYGWRGDRTLNQIKYIVLHHTVSTAYSNIDKEVDQIAKYHINTNKWGGCGYHFIISTEEKNGLAKVGYVGDIASIRAHTPNMKGAFSIPAKQGNIYTLGIALVGDFTNKQPSPAQLKSTHLLCNQLIYKESQYSELKSWDNLKSHKDFDYTSCPANVDPEKIINQNIIPAEKSGYEKALEEAENWNDEIQKKYGFKIINLINKNSVSRQDLIIILNNFKKYLDKEIR